MTRHFDPVLLMHVPKIILLKICIAAVLSIKNDEIHRILIFPKKFPFKRNKMKSVIPQTSAFAGNEI